MNFSFVRGFICSTFGLLNPYHLIKYLSISLSELLIIWLPEGKMKKGFIRGGEERRASLESRIDQFHPLL